MDDILNEFMNSLDYFVDEPTIPEFVLESEAAEMKIEIDSLK